MKNCWQQESRWWSIFGLLGVDQVIIGKCDVDDNDDLTGKFGIRNIPTVLFIKNGEVMDKSVGAVTKAQLEEKVKALL